MARNDIALLLDMLLAAQKIVRFSENLTRETLVDEEMALSAIVREFQVIGEAGRMVSDETKAEHSQIQWQAISGLRNRVIHEYFRIDLDILWLTIQDDIPDLIKELNLIIPSDEDDNAN